MTGDRKTEPPFGLDMDFGEAMERFLQVNPKEVVESVDRSKQKKPLREDSPQRPVRSDRSRASPGRKRKPDDT